MIRSTTDIQSLADYVRTQSPKALAPLVLRHVDLVYDTARRVVGDPALAEDVTQAAFIVLMRKAKTISPHTLPGWLVNTTRQAAKQALRKTITRQKHEHRAAALRTELSEPPEQDPSVRELLPLLDDALARLNETDRTAIVLRFLQGHSFAEVGRAMESSEEAARKRVTRAVEKLRVILTRQGVAPSVGGLMIVLAATQAKAAPPAVVDGVTAAISTGGSTGSLILAKGVCFTMNLSKIKVLSAVAAALLLTAIGVTARITHAAQGELPSVALVIAAIQAHAAQLADGHVVYSERMPPDTNLWQNEFWQCGPWFRHKHPYSDEGFDGTMYYSFDRKNTEVWLAVAPPESALDSDDVPRFTGSLGPQLFKYLQDHLTHVSLTVDQNSADIIYLSIDIPLPDVWTAMDGVPGACDGGASVKLTVNTKENYALQSIEERGLEPHKGLLGSRCSWGGWNVDAKGFWFPHSYLEEVYNVPDKGQKEGPPGFSMEYKYDRIEGKCGLTKATFVPPEIPAGYRIMDARAERHPDIVMTKPIPNVENYTPEALINLKNQNK